MSYWKDPIRKAAALAKAKATREALGARLGFAPTGGRPRTTPSAPGRKKKPKSGGSHPTRDSGS
jgi:hypothetical protein